MRNNETGEFELVVGNKQLLSGFFIVVLLFAVAFAMGYVVGQNTQRPAKTGVGRREPRARRQRPRRIRGRSLHRRSPAPVSPAPAPAAARHKPPPRTQHPQPTTQPAQASQPAARPRRRQARGAAARPRASLPSSELPPGSYWQVLAVKPEVAEAMRQTLKDKGFQVSLTPGTNNLTRVLVGPYADTPSLGRAKTELETAGFQPGAVQA